VAQGRVTVLGVELVLTSVTAVIVAVIGVWQARAGRSLREVRDQVANTHTTVSLRDDIDHVKRSVQATEVKLADLGGRFDGLHELVRSQGHQLGELRADLHKN
jgi:HAMP domain-containing protein